MSAVKLSAFYKARKQGLRHIRLAGHGRDVFGMAVDATNQRVVVIGSAGDVSAVPADSNQARLSLVAPTPRGEQYHKAWANQYAQPAQERMAVLDALESTGNRQLSMLGCAVYQDRPFDVVFPVIIGMLREGLLRVVGNIVP
jgi:hypothetical protein